LLYSFGCSILTFFASTASSEVIDFANETTVFLRILSA
jgi:hypothetical protein